ncbi:MAG: hypothetical protein V1904_15735 [Bacteroidota bacterium]
MKKFLSFLIVLFVLVHAKAQDNYDWWVQIHNWDGVTSWYQYLKITPQFMGPNALPIPEVQKGITGDRAILELAADGHFSKGDKTQNAYTMLYYPVVSKLVAIEGYVVPIEHFKMDTMTRDERAARDRDGEGTAGGDIYFGTIIQLVKEKKFPDMALRLSVRTASGTNVSAARYTNAPGYFFDLSIGKEYINEKYIMNKIRWYTMIGFYSWQTNNVGYFQDDAFLYGAGIDFSFSKVVASFNAGGYYGYVNNHDRPVIARLQLTKEAKKHSWGLKFQIGLNDYPYYSVRIFFKYTLPDAVLLNKGCK